jgi:hypothetical protein
MDRADAKASIASRPNVRDDRETSLLWVQDDRNIAQIADAEKQNIFDCRA